MANLIPGMNVFRIKTDKDGVEKFWLITHDKDNPPESIQIDHESDLVMDIDGNVIGFRDTRT